MSQLITADQAPACASNGVCHGDGYSIGAFRLAPPPILEPPVEEEETNLERSGEHEAVAAPGRIRVGLEALSAFVGERWYDAGVSLLILASGAVALYLLMWMGQP